MSSKRISKSFKVTVDKKAAAERVRKIWPLLLKAYPNAGTALSFSNPFELLVATILSAQCTDKTVNAVTKDLFRKYRSAADLAAVPKPSLEKQIKSTGFFRNKAASIKGACSQIAARYDGRVPSTIDKLVSLPGVGRKTANVVLGNAFGTPAIVCDTHVIRLSRRLELSANRDPVKLEFDLAEIVPKKKWTLFSHLLIFHGRNACRARRPDCPGCTIAKFCPAAERPEKW
jgi:endonuclease-3